MKVTVCFGDVRVIVPCGSGDLLVGDLIEKAILRYKKATGKPPDYWVAVHNLKSVSDGGILDADDQLNDVADDREQIIALYEEQDGPPAHHNGGDGTSASSVGTSSPDIFQGGDLSGALNNNTKGFSPIMRYEGKNDVVITPNDLTSGSSLIVRRGSEPTLNTVGTSVPSLNVVHIGDGNLKASKRWSAIAAIDEVRSKDSGNSEDDEKPLPPHRMEGNGEEKSAFSRFARDSARQSLASNSSAMYKWLEAQERQENHYNEMRDGRKEPLGGTDASDDENIPRSAFLPPQKKEGELIVFRNTRSGPLGIHVVPNYADDGRDMGLVIQGIEAGGRTYQDGRLHVQDRIVEINGTSLMDVDFQKAQEIFKQSIFSDEVRLRVIKSDLAPVMKQPPPVLPKPSIKKKPDNLDLSKLNTKGQNGLGSPQQQSSPARVQSPVSPTQTNGQVSPSSPGKKVPPAVPARHPNTSLSTAKGRLPALTNTRKIGKKLLIQLTKGPDGLGFSITTRDNPAGGNCPIYIKNILPKGAAVRDGKLKSGDRLLEVNGIEMTGKTQADAVSILRNTKLGSVVNLQVSRQVLASEADTFAVPRELTSSRVLQPSDKSGDDGNLAPNKNKEILAYEIPLNETGSAGLGVSVKGKTSTNAQGTQDLGIFIKAVITGGAASKDGRLKVNDQLLKVNGESLISKSNTDAMDTLRTAMQKDGPIPGNIHIIVARRRDGLPINTAKPEPKKEVRVSSSEHPDGEERPPSTSGTSENSDQTVIHLAHDSNAAKSNNVSKTKGDATYAEVNKFRHPATDRLTSTSSVHSQSYMRAVHPSLTDTPSPSSTPDKDKRPAQQKNNGLTISSPRLGPLQGQTVLIEGDNYQVQMRQNNSPKARPASTIGFLRPTPDVISTVPSSRSNENLLEEDTAPKPPDWLMKWDEKREEDLSPTDSEPSVPFQREGFGRQSMSEKRRTQLDPRNTEIYQKVKMNKEGGQDENHSDHGKPADHGSGEDSSETHGLTDLPSPGLLKRVGSAESLVSQTNRSSVHENKDLGPMLGLKKSSSLESLQAAVQEVSLEDEGNYFKAPNRGMVRGRGCNDSFRAAVDRSYEAPMETEPMETLEEEGSESGSGGQGRGSVSTHSSFSSNEPQVQEVDVSKKQRKKKEKGGGIFKGLGHMFRFGRHRKAMEERAPKQTAAELHKQREQELLKQRQEEIEKYKARHHQEQERERIKEHYLKLQDGQRMPEPQRPHPPEDVYPPVDNYESRSGSPSTPQTRAERIQQLRAEHQRRHRERQGQYPLDAQEEQYEQQMRLYERQYKGEELVHPAYVLPPRRRSEDPYDSHCPYIFRPVSRLGHVDPNHYSHYQNYDEIRAQLQRHDHLQQAYHQHHLQQQMGRQPSANSVPDPRSYAGYDPRVHMQSDNRVYPMHEQDSRGYLHARPPQEHWDSRGWLHGQPARTKTPSDWSSGSHSPPRARSNTPINQMGYLSHHNSKPPLGTMMVTHDNYRDYMDYDDPRHAYSEQTSYGSLPRANRLKNTVISGSAQV